MMKWYSVDERTPEHGVNVLLLFPANMAVGCYDEHSKCWSVASGNEIYTDVADDEVKPTHWAELPCRRFGTIDEEVSFMSDLISREAAIAAIENARQLFALPDDVPGSRMVNTGFAAARGALEKVTPESGWISANDRLPEEDKRVLIYDDVCREACVANLHEGVWHGEAYQEEHDASHWMELPAPPTD